MELKERFIVAIEALGLTTNAFEKEAGISRGTVGRLEFGLRTDKLANIARAFPQLNLRYLLLEESPIILGAMDADALTEEKASAKEMLVEELNAKVARLSAEVEWLRSVVDAESRAIAALTGSSDAISATTPEQ